MLMQYSSPSVTTSLPSGEGLQECMRISQMWDAFQKCAAIIFKCFQSLFTRATMCEMKLQILYAKQPRLANLLHHLKDLASIYRP